MQFARSEKKSAAALEYKLPMAIAAQRDHSVGTRFPRAIGRNGFRANIGCHLSRALSFRPRDRRSIRPHLEAQRHSHRLNHLSVVCEKG
jgi:hypothetical protein